MSEQETKVVKIHATLVEKINFACHERALAILRELGIRNLNLKTSFQLCQNKFIDLWWCR